MKITIAQHLFVAFLAAGLSGCGRQTRESPPAVAPAAEVNATNQAAATATPSLGFAKLTGKWLRPDGDYVIQIRSVEPSGKMDAAYFNPQPIHVATAEASQNGETIKVFIELRDVNYPGSTYRLSYDPGNDRLTGAYFQAVARETYDVFFVRMQP